MQLGVVMLCHNEMPTATRMARVWAEGGARVVIHVDADVSRDAFATLMTDLAGQDRIVQPRGQPQRAVERRGEILGAVVNKGIGAEAYHIFAALG